MKGKIPIAVVLGVALVAAVGVGGAIWVMGQGGQSVGDTARLVPADVAVYATINTDPTSHQWAQMQSLLSRLGVKDQAQSTRDEGLRSTDLDWDEDIAPYLGGEATVAVRNVEESSPGVLVVLATSDSAKAWDHAVAYLDKQARSSNERATSHTYRATEVRVYAGEFSSGLWIARKDRYLILGTESGDAERVLDLAAGVGDSLARLDRFRKARAAVTDDSLLFLYVNPAALGDAASSFTAAFAPGGSADALDAAGLENTAIAFAASAERPGLRIEWQTVGLDQTRNPVALKPAPKDSRFAGRLPADTLFFISGADLYNSFIKGALAALDRAGSGGDEIRTQIDDFNRQSGIDLERDFLGQLTGEYAVAAGATSVSTDDAWVVAMSGVRDGGALGRTLAKIEDYARRDGASVGTSKAGGKTITRISGGGTDSNLFYTLDGNDLIAGSDVDAVQKGLGSGGLDRDPDYRDALKALPAGRSLTVFVNLARLLQLQPDVADVIGGATTQNLRSFSVALTQNGDRIGGVLFLRVAGE